MRLAPCVIAALASAALCTLCTPPAPALDPHRAISQYIRDRWGSEQGLTNGQVYAITQTSDGYLWIGTQKGLVRFDGLNFRPMQQLIASTNAASSVLGLESDTNGGLFVRVQGPHVLEYRDGKLQDIVANLEQGEGGVTALCRDRKGGILFAGLNNGVVRYRNGKAEVLASADVAPRAPAISLAETADGKVWLGTRETGLFMLSDGKVSRVAGDLPDKKVNALLSTRDGKLWIGTDNGLAFWNGKAITGDGVPPALRNTQVLTMTEDRDSNLWLGTALGLMRLDAKGMVSVAEPNQRNEEGALTALLEDREGNLWVGTGHGLERIREGAFATYTTTEGLRADSNGPLYADDSGRIWIAPISGGLYWLKDGRTGAVTSDGLDRDVVYSLSGGKNEFGHELWIGRQRGGLTRLRYGDGSGPGYTAERYSSDTYTVKQGLVQDSVYAVHRSRDGAVWAGTISRGVSVFRGGRFTNYTTLDGLASNTVNAIAEGSDSSMWFATANGVSNLSRGQWKSYSLTEGLPSVDVNCLLEDSGGVLWIGTANGLALLRSSVVSAIQNKPAALRESILGLTQDRRGSLWIMTTSHVLRVNRDKLLSGSLEDTEMREYGISDGLRSVEGVKRDGSVALDPQGRIWLSMSRGVSVVDPASPAAQSVPTIVSIEAISADGNPLDSTGQSHAVRVPAGRQRLIFTFAGLSLAVPERVRFRYRLDGFDRDWSEPVSTHQAVYTNIGPGQYRFHVMASNSDGIWDTAQATGVATLPLQVLPAFWQSWWFRMLVVFTAALAALSIYRLRLYQLSRQYNLRFEERLAERTRLAQELHDTLLQGFLSASMQLHVAAEHVPEDSSAKPMIDRVLALMTQVIEEGRNALRGLRASSQSSRDLEQAFARVAQELAFPKETAYRVVVQGPTRALQPAIREEVYRIGREALTNAFRHSHASSIEAEIEYSTSRLRVLIRDNGSGIDPRVLISGRDGHWGLQGMRERAESIGAKLRLLSRDAGGTEVELSVPGKIAFRDDSKADSKSKQGHSSDWTRGLAARLYAGGREQKIRDAQERHAESNRTGIDTEAD